MANNGVAKNQHYVPRFLLENFSNAKKQKKKGKKKEELYIHVFDKSDDRDFGANIKTIATENGFYDFTLEDGSEQTWEVALSVLEGKASVLIKQIINEKSLKSLSDEQREVLSLFFSVQLVRTRHAREYFKDMILKISNHLNSLFFGKYSFYKEDDIESILSDEGMKLYTAESIYEAGGEYLPHFFNKQWTLYEAPKDKSFYIGDNPVALYSHLPSRFGTHDVGIAVKGIEIFIPISNKLVVALVCPDMLSDTAEIIKSIKSVNRSSINYKVEELKRANKAQSFMNRLLSGDAILVEDDQLIFINSLQVKYSNRFVFSSDGDFELVKQMIRDDESYRSGVRGRIGMLP